MSDPIYSNCGQLIVTRPCSFQSQFVPELVRSLARSSGLLRLIVIVYLFFQIMNSLHWISRQMPYQRYLRYDLKLSIFLYFMHYALQNFSGKMYLFRSACSSRNLLLLVKFLNVEVPVYDSAGSQLFDG